MDIVSVQMQFNGFGTEPVQLDAVTLGYTNRLLINHDFALVNVQFKALDLPGVTYCR